MQRRQLQIPSRGQLGSFDQRDRRNNEDVVWTKTK
jgi:hypothetical protein